MQGTGLKPSEYTLNLIQDWGLYSKCAGTVSYSPHDRRPGISHKADVAVLDDKTVAVVDRVHWGIVHVDCDIAIDHFECLFWSCCFLTTEYVKDLGGEVSTSL